MKSLFLALMLAAATVAVPLVTSNEAAARYCTYYCY